MSFGITLTEAKIYQEIAKSPETKIGPIIKASGLHRGTVYNAIESLIEKGFICFIDQEKQRFYKISGKKIFESIIRERQRETKETKAKIDSLFGDIIKNQEPNKRQEVEVFYGVSSFKNLFLEMLDICKKKKIEYLFNGRGCEMQEATGEAFYKSAEKMKKCLGIKCRIIFDRSTAKKPYHRYIIGNIRYLPTTIGSPVNFWIYDDIVLIVLFGVSPLASVRMQSKILSDAFKNCFERLWKVTKS
jgi:sugar-specific transcriptional regulator TrmB